MNSQEALQMTMEFGETVDRAVGWMMQYVNDPNCPMDDRAKSRMMICVQIMETQKKLVGDTAVKLVETDEMLAAARKKLGM